MIAWDRGLPEDDNLVTLVCFLLPRVCFSVVLKSTETPSVTEAPSFCFPPTESFPHTPYFLYLFSLKFSLRDNAFSGLNLYSSHTGYSLDIRRVALFLLTFALRFLRREVLHCALFFGCFCGLDGGHEFNAIRGQWCIVHLVI